MSKHLFRCENNKEFFLLNDLYGCLNLVFSPSTASHIGFANYLLFIGNKVRVNFRAVCHRKIAFPFIKNLLKWFKYFTALDRLIPILKYLVKISLPLFAAIFFKIRQIFLIHLIIQFRKLSRYRNNYIGVFSTYFNINYCRTMHIFDFFNSSKNISFTYILRHSRLTFFE